ncbi:c-type cytochrome [Bradyrhizobium sp. WD16]|uniref:c-type cytochrome n=1 Tax=Bradyrhizobium sp. WD16 TaxID=1521768 RepID=UPI0020A518AA|nr:c-type cytochrome [Bradyrhizobium sp. WD16]UTD30054.1 cytochrome C [Bradyrhizobium sp. WD16]
MRRIDPRTALQAAAFAAALAVTGSSGPGRAATAGGHDFQAKVEFCKTCHGLSGQGYRGYFPMPRLAGQPSEYFENQLRAFAGRHRTNTIMAGVARSLSPPMIAALAAHFRSLDPPPIGGGPRAQAGRGKTIFELGIPEANVPACSACHGDDGRGRNEIPRLAGQLYEYTVAKLANWSKERTDSNAAVMGPTSHNLTASQIAAVAAYVSDLK